nr:hypothetical protein [Tanacetum cinerariifolium]
ANPRRRASDAGAVAARPQLRQGGAGGTARQSAAGVHHRFDYYP